MNKTLALVDTNILIYAADDQSPFHQKAKQFLEDNSTLVNFVLSLQNVTEFYSLVTNSKTFKMPFSPVKAREEAEKLISDGFYTIILPTAKTPTTFVRLLGNFQAKGADVHDVNLSAVAIDNGINTIYTADPKIFSRLGLKAINPLK